jgi:hypothetical protein
VSTRSTRGALPGNRADVRPTARQSSLRTRNLAAVARAVVATGVPLSRTDVAATVATTRSTDARLVDELVEGGVLTELQNPNPTGRGRPATPLVANPRRAALGLQVNTTVLAALSTSREQSSPSDASPETSGAAARGACSGGSTASHSRSSTRSVSGPR